MESRLPARRGETALSPERRSGLRCLPQGGGTWGNHGFPHAQKRVRYSRISHGVTCSW
jgi:hypothetical protein